MVQFRRSKSPSCCHNCITFWLIFAILSLAEGSSGPRQLETPKSNCDPKHNCQLLGPVCNIQEKITVHFHIQYALCIRMCVYVCNRTNTTTKYLKQPVTQSCCSQPYTGARSKMTQTSLSKQARWRNRSDCYGFSWELFYRRSLPILV